MRKADEVGDGVISLRAARERANIQEPSLFIRKTFIDKLTQLLTRISKKTTHITDILAVDYKIINAISAPELIITFGSGFPESLAEVIRVTKWIILANMSLAAFLGIYTMYNPKIKKNEIRQLPEITVTIQISEGITQNIRIPTEGATSDNLRYHVEITPEEIPARCSVSRVIENIDTIHEAITEGCNRFQFTITTDIAMALLDYKNDRKVDIRNSLFYAGFIPMPAIVLFATIIAHLTKYKLKPCKSQSDIYVALSFLALQGFTAGSTIHTAWQLMMLDILKDTSVTYQLQFDRFFISLLTGFALQIPQVVDAFPAKNHEYQLVKLLHEDRLPRQVINFILNIASSYNNAVFWIFLLLSTFPANPNNIYDAFEYVITVYWPLLLIMSPVLAKLLDVTVMQLLELLMDGFNKLTSIFNWKRDPAGVDEESPLLIGDRHDQDSLLHQRPLLPPSEGHPRQLASPTDDDDGRKLNDSRDITADPKAQASRSQPSSLSNPAAEQHALPASAVSVSAVPPVAAVPKLNPPNVEDSPVVQLTEEQAEIAALMGLFGSQFELQHEKIPSTTGAQVYMASPKQPHL